MDGMCMGTRYPDSPNDRSSADGTAFELYVIELLAKIGIVLRRCETFDEQVTIGDACDNDQIGYEIKLDQRCEDTGRLSIEVAEKTALHRPWVDSGIFSSSNATYYIQGRPGHLWIFRRTDLQQYYRIHRPRVIDDNPPTIKKFYISTNTFPKDLQVIPVTKTQNRLDTLRVIAAQRPINWSARRKRASDWNRTHKTIAGYPYQDEPDQ